MSPWKARGRSVGHDRPMVAICFRPYHTGQTDSDDQNFNCDHDHISHTKTSSPMQLGLVTYMWGADWDLPTLIKNCQLTGFAGVELRSDAQARRRADAFGRRAQATWPSASPTAASSWSGLGTACEYHSPDPAVVKKNIDETKDFIKLCHDCGGTGVKVRPNGLPKEVPVREDAGADRPVA